MQSLTWYWRRLRSMPASELSWRLGASLQQLGDYVAAPSRRKGVPLSKVTHLNGQVVLRVDGGETVPLLMRVNDSNLSKLGDDCQARLVEAADKLLCNRLSVFEQDSVDFGDKVDWNYECAAKKKTPMSFAPRVDYRDYSVAGDAKIAWEPSRHQHLGVLGRAYRATSDPKYARKVVEHIDSWIEQCPFGRGMQWRSPLELAIRLINWVWALELISGSDAIDDRFRNRLLPVVYRHIWEIDRKYSRCTSANNHLIGEAAGVLIGGRYFDIFRDSEKWVTRSRQILLDEIDRQTHPDGGNVEQAMGYQLFVMEFLLLAGLAVRDTDHAFPESYWKRLEGMFDYVAAFVEGGKAIPFYGDCDDGYVLDLGTRSDYARGMLGIGAVLFEREEWTSLAAECQEPALWLTGRSAGESLSGNNDVSGTLMSHSFPATGYYILQAGHRDASDAMSVVFDCAELGFGAIAAHGHADALSFTLRVAGEDLLVDPGTYDYFTWQEWRDYFRSTRAHNTVVVDGQDQSMMLGSFLWGQRASCDLLQWSPTDNGGVVEGEHDGYRHLADPVTHRRQIELDGAAGRVSVRDSLLANNRHSGESFLHLSESCRVKRIDGNCFEVTCGKVRLELSMDARLEVSVHQGSEDPIFGWVSRGYHRRVPGTTIAGRFSWQGGISLETSIIVCDRG